MKKILFLLMFFYWGLYSVDINATNSSANYTCFSLAMELYEIFLPNMGHAQALEHANHYYYEICLNDPHMN